MKNKKELLVLPLFGGGLRLHTNSIYEDAELACTRISQTVPLSSGMLQNKIPLEKEETEVGPMTFHLKRKVVELK